MKTVSPVEASTADNGELLPKSILGAGSRIIPSDKVDDFEKGNSVAVEAAMEHYGLTAEQIASVNWENFFVTNLVPVTIGNIIGGGLVVGLLYWLIYVKKSK